MNEDKAWFVAKGERSRPVFLIAPTEYIPVCNPVFRLDRCHHKEEDVLSDVTVKLLRMHKIDGVNDNGTETDASAFSCSAPTISLSTTDTEPIFCTTCVNRNDGMKRSDHKSRFTH